MNSSRSDFLDDQRKAKKWRANKLFILHMEGNPYLRHLGSVVVFCCLVLSNSCFLHLQIFRFSQAK